MTEIVFSDLAGTVLVGNPWDAIRQHPTFREANGQREVWKFLPTYIGNKVKLVSDSALRDRWLRAMTAALGGVHRDTITAMYADVLRTAEKTRYREDVVAQLQRHKASGGTVILVSGMFIEMVEMVADDIGADAAIGTRIAYDAEGCATGSIIGDTCVGARKLDFIRRYLAQHHPGVSLSECYGYADSYSDRSLLQAVGHSVATHPDDNLRVIAHEAGWDIIS